MEVPISIIDAFASEPFKGNPAAVCRLQPENEPADSLLQNLAMEMNLSETAFVYPPSQGVFRLRWFTPATEVDLCGHATLASAFAIWSDRLLPWEQEIVFQTRSGHLTCRSYEQSGSTWIELNFPRLDYQQVDPPAELVEALGIAPIAVVRSSMDCLVEASNLQEIEQLRPNMKLLANFQARGVIVTAAAGKPDVDFVSRFFAPAVGVPEDPVTGSAHCLLAPYWANKLGKTSMTGFQASRRGGQVKVRVANERVFLAGRAFRVLQGTIRFA